MQQPPRKSYTGWLITIGVLGGTIIACCAGGILLSRPSSDSNNSDTGASQQFANSTVPPAPTWSLPPANMTEAITNTARSAAGDASAFAAVTVVRGVVTISFTLGDQFNSSIAAQVCKHDTFLEMQALYTSGDPISEVDLTINGPLTDQYGNNSIGPYAIVTLTVATAKLFNWSNLNEDTAWPDYDTAWVRAR